MKLTFLSQTKTLLAAIGLLAASAGAVLAVPFEINYQGVLTDANGALVGSPDPQNTDVQFRIYDRATGGTRLWSEAHNVSVFKGKFSTIIGLGTPLTTNEPNTFANLHELFESGSDRFLEVTIPVQGSEFPSAITFEPRQKIVASPFALVTESARSVIDGGVTNAMLANSAIDTSKIADNAVTHTQLAAGSVQASELATGAVTGVKIGNGAISNSHLASNAVTGGKIADGTITGSDIANNAITQAKLSGNAITGGHIVDGAVQGVDVQDGSLTGADIQNNSIAGIDIQDGSIQTADIGRLTQLYIGGAPDKVWKMDTDGNGALYFVSWNGTNSFEIFPDGTTTTNSDRRLKTEVKKLDDLLGDIMSLNPVDYRWKSDSSDRNPQMGFIAQEVREVFPDMVREMANGYLGLDYSRFGVVAVGAIQELHVKSHQADVEQVTRIQKLEQENAALQKRLEQIEKALATSGSEIR